MIVADELSRIIYDNRDQKEIIIPMNLAISIYLELNKIEKIEKIIQEKDMR